MAMITVCESGVVQLKCSDCGVFREYSSEPKARQAIKHKRVCRACAVVRRRRKRSSYGFSIHDINRFRGSAAQRGYEWGVDEDIIQTIWGKQGGRCAMTGTVMQKHPRTWSIDRIDNSCGYTLTNIQLTLKQLNMMRGTLSVDEFINYCREVSAYRSAK